MVVFTCQHCGDSVNKPKVAKHYLTKCRNKHPSLTCVDCLKDFIGDEYDVHTQCMTEAERYSAKGTVFKENTGRKKQAKYVEMIQNLLNTNRDLSYNQRKLLELCTDYDNIPRKHGKFLNFMKNIARKTKHTKEDLDSVFHLIEDGWLKEVQAKSSVVQSSKESSLIKEGVKTEESGVELEEADVSLKTNTDSNKNKKKKHSESSQLLNSSEEAEANGVNDKSGTDLESSVETKKTKKKKHNTSQYQEDDEKCVENNKHDVVFKDSEHSSNTDEKNNSSPNANVGEGNSNTESNKTVKEMSKKILKKQKKYEKYLQELENETESKSKDEDREKSDDNNVYNSKKKLKKSKKHVNTVNEHHEDNSTCHMEVEPQEGESQKKNKKRKHNDSQSEINGKKMKSEIALKGEEEEQSHASFDWADVIIRVLESRPDKELSLKKLGKKVINEYQTVKADHRTYEELLVRFNKKVMKTRRVRVLKEKAKIIE